MTDKPQNLFAQTQHHAGSGQPRPQPQQSRPQSFVDQLKDGPARILPPSQQQSLPFTEILPPEAMADAVNDPDDITLFEAEDIQQALRMFDSAPFDRHVAMREVMLFSLRIAAINLNVK